VVLLGGADVPVEARGVYPVELVDPLVFVADVAAAVDGAMLGTVVARLVLVVVTVVVVVVVAGMVASAGLTELPVVVGDSVGDVDVGEVHFWAVHTRPGLQLSYGVAQEPPSEFSRTHLDTPSTGLHESPEAQTW
jgi:hypothetical protein